MPGVRLAAGSWRALPCVPRSTSVVLCHGNGCSERVWMPNSLMDQAKFRKTMSRAVMWPLLVMAVVTAIAVLQVGRLLAATRWVDHTDQVIATARLSQKQIFDIQAGLRSYYI